MKFNKSLAIATVMASIFPTMANTLDPNNPSGTVVDRFADIEVLRYVVPGFQDLSLNQKKLIYFLTEAALQGRDIIWDQNGKYNLPLRQMLETVYTNYEGDRESKDFKAFETYLKQVEFGNGAYHHYSMDKFTPGFSSDWLGEQLRVLADKGIYKRSPEELRPILSLIFDPTFMPKRVNQAAGEDLILTSACNLYDNISQPEVEGYYAALKDTTDLTPISYGLNSRLVKTPAGDIKEEAYMLGGYYSDAIARIIDNLEKAKKYAESPKQAAVIDELIKFYRTGDLKLFDSYSILWTEDTESQVDFINGFIESYGDPLGMTGSWESIVNFRDEKASARTKTLAANAQWFEDNSPVDPRFRKPEVKGVSAKVSLLYTSPSPRD